MIVVQTLVNIKINILFEYDNLIYINEGDRQRESEKESDRERGRRTKTEIERDHRVP